MYPTIDQRILNHIQSIAKYADRFETAIADGRTAEADIAWETSERLEYQLDCLKLAAMRKANGTIDPPINWHGVNGPCGERKPFRSIVPIAAQRAA